MSEYPQRRKFLRRWLTLAAILPALVVAAALTLHTLDQQNPPPTALPAVSPVVLAADGALLRAFTVDDGTWRLPVALEEVDNDFIRLLIAYEDQRFQEHQGVDPRALLRAASQALRHRRIVSGASTLTMQTVRLLTKDRARTATRKLIEIARALQLERRLTKDEILKRYLFAAPYGGNIEGVRAASLAYFGREPGRLTLAQSALLIALPQSPEARRPDRHPETARRARNRVLDRLAARGAITPAEATRAKTETIPTRRRAVPKHAPHLARHLVTSGDPVIKTTLDKDWQAALETLAATRVDHIDPNVSAAILVAEHRTGRIRASVGAAKFLDPRRAGHVDMTTALRSPGSTLKPFIYGLGIDAGLIARTTLVSDTPKTFDGYQPENFDDTFQGTVTIEEALRQSLNVPAVTVLDALGPVRLAVRLREAGATVALPPQRGPTLAIGLGGFGTTLTALAGLYAAFPNAGQPVHLWSTARKPLPQRALSPRAAQSIGAILTKMRPPKNAERDRVAYKTGTSYGHRDAWAVGYDGRHVIAVWIGRPDGTPLPELTGWLDAAPLLFDAFARIGITPLPPQPTATPTASLPPPLQHFPPQTARKTPPVRIAFPPENAVVALSTDTGETTPLLARVVGRPVDLWLLNGRPVNVRPKRRRATLNVPKGRHTLTVVTADGASERVNFTVE
ncbi:MAG: penicillin-binding protein 1C [Pseudomonadota bacterium]